jgi:hypothetical protein
MNFVLIPVGFVNVACDPAGKVRKVQEKLVTAVVPDPVVSAIK